VEETITEMIIIRSIFYTILVLLATTTVIATVYISMWLVFGLAIIMVGLAIYTLLKAKSNL